MVFIFSRANKRSSVKKKTDLGRIAPLHPNFRIFILEAPFHLRDRKPSDFNNIRCKTFISLSDHPINNFPRLKNLYPIEHTVELFSVISMIYHLMQDVTQQIILCGDHLDQILFVMAIYMYYSSTKYQSPQDAMLELKQTELFQKNLAEYYETSPYVASIKQYEVTCHMMMENHLSQPQACRIKSIDLKGLAYPENIMIFMYECRTRKKIALLPPVQQDHFRPEIYQFQIKSRIMLGDIIIEFFCFNPTNQSYERVFRYCVNTLYALMRQGDQKVVKLTIPKHKLDWAYHSESSPMNPPDSLTIYFDLVTPNAEWRDISYNYKAQLEEVLSSSPNAYFNNPVKLQRSRIGHVKIGHREKLKKLNMEFQDLHKLFVDSTTSNGIFQTIHDLEMNNQHEEIDNFDSNDVFPPIDDSKVVSQNIKIQKPNSPASMGSSVSSMTNEWMKPSSSPEIHGNLNVLPLISTSSSPLRPSSLMQAKRMTPSTPTNFSEGGLLDTKSNKSEISEDKAKSTDSNDIEANLLSPINPLPKDTLSPLSLKPPSLENIAPSGALQPPSLLSPPNISMLSPMGDFGNSGFLSPPSGGLQPPTGGLQPPSGFGLQPPSLNSPLSPAPPKIQLRKFHWKPIKHVSENALWFDETPVEVDQEEVVLLFKIPPKKKKEVAKASSKSKMIRLLDTKRAQQVEIILNQFKKMSYSEIVKIIEDLEIEELSLSQIEGLQHCIPIDDEISKIESYKGDAAYLHQAEQFLVRLMTIRRLPYRIKSFLYMKGFKNLVLKFQKSIQMKCDCYIEIINSEFLKCVFKTIVAMGNILNKGNKRLGNAKGFELDALKLLVDIRTNSKKRNSMLEILCTYTNDQFQDKKLSDELPNLIPASEFMISMLSESEQQINQIANHFDSEVKVIMNGSQNEYNKDEVYNTKVQSFHSHVNSEFGKLRKLRDSLNDKYSELLQYFSIQAAAEDMSKEEEILQTIVNFVQQYDRASDIVSKNPPIPIDVEKENATEA